MIRIGIVGPESSGKSTLAEGIYAQYASDMRVVRVEEVARHWLSERDGKYAQKDLWTIATLQRQAEQQVLSQEKNPDLLISDTTQLVIRIWSLYRYGHCDARIERACQSEYYDFYFLCDTSLPWNVDSLREHQQHFHRRAIFSLYEGYLQRNNRPFAVLSSSCRLKEALAHLQTFFDKEKQPKSV